MKEHVYEGTKMKGEPSKSAPEKSDLTLAKELEYLLNRHTHSVSPDGILAQYLIDCLETFNKAVKAMEK